MLAGPWGVVIVRRAAATAPGIDDLQVLRCLNALDAVICVVPFIVVVAAAATVFGCHLSLLRQFTKNSSVKSL